MASQTTNLPLQSGKGSNKQSVKVQVSIDPDNPGQPPSVIDRDTGSVIGQWDSNANAFVATVDGRVGKNQPISEFLAQNQSQLKKTTTNSINNLNSSQKKGFADGGSYNTGVQGSSATPAGNGTATAKPKSIQGGNQPPQVTLASLSGQDASLRYPSTISGDFVLFEIYEYNGPGVNPSSNFGLTTVRAGNKVASIALPIQASITDSNTVDWKEDTLNALQGSLGAVALGMLGQKEQKDALGQLIKSATAAAGEDTKGGEGGDLARAIKFASASAAVNSNLRSRFSGEVMNPNLELLFNGPRLRNFNFAFFMSARDEGEATTIKKIIKTFKEKMAVRDGPGSLFLKAPHIFQITYKTDTGGQHPALNQIKLCAMTGFNVNYTPAGTYSTFEDLTMTAYQMNMQFTELDPVYESDYASSNDIGF
jgi:hypothetical protein